MRVVLTGTDDRRAYAVLDDDVVIISPVLDCRLCARLHAGQVADLNLDPEKLVSWFGWEILDD